jgi:hypothetical protein
MPVLTQEDVQPKATLLRCSRAYEASLDMSMHVFPVDEKEGDNAVNYNEDSPEEERSLPGEAQEGTPLSTEACQQAIDEAYATFVQNAGIVTSVAVSNRDKEKHEAEGQQAMVGIGAVPILNASQALRQTDIMNLVENKDFRLKVPNFNHDPQRSGLEEVRTLAVYCYSSTAVLLAVLFWLIVLTKEITMFLYKDKGVRRFAM